MVPGLMEDKLAKAVQSQESKEQKGLDVWPLADQAPRPCAPPLLPRAPDEGSSEVTMVHRVRTRSSLRPARRVSGTAMVSV